MWMCETSHTSGTFATDWLTNGYWSPLSPPPGSIMMLGKSAIAGITGWLLCDNSALSRTTYADLFAVLNTVFGTGDGSTTFNIPDFRGIFPRGAGTSAKLSRANGAAFACTLGNYDNDKMQGHRHSSTVNSGSNTNAAGTYSTMTLNFYSVATNNAVAVTDPSSNGSHGTPRTGVETNPANLGINFMIKY
ncbi:MAG: tail fiber protein [Spirochaetes bacterium]|nr:tail fiber protein [Spirochaetota bacterium]